MSQKFGVFFFPITIAVLCIPTLTFASLSSGYTVSTSQTVDTRNGIFSDWVVPSPSALVADRQAAGNLLSVQLGVGSLPGYPIGTPNATFLYNQGTPVVTGSTLTDCPVFATGANGSGYSAFTVQAQVPAGSSGTLTVYDPEINGNTGYFAQLSGPSDPSTILDNYIYSQGDGYFVANYSAVGNATLDLTVQNYEPVNNGYAVFGGATLTITVPEPAQAAVIVLSLAPLMLRTKSRRLTKSDW